ncbi:hypothetical protein ACWEWI_14730 [Streptomyces sp. NPDC003753]|uniref:hypothetical protein n=1 Tax=Streptomyces sp. Y2F8-2 TaxID=2759675 RepID=UPI001F1AF1A8|nr:hypothetical protein [Streptomyces sp. Y2F8-2]
MPEWMTRSFSMPRLRPYLRASGGDAQAAMRLYQWNLEASAALYVPLHCVELAVRNALHDCLVAAYGRPDWWSTAPLNDGGRGLVGKARAKSERNEEQRAKEQRRPKRPVTADDVVTELSFGFWAALLVSRYDRVFWVPTLHKAFPYHSGRRDALYEDLWSLVRLRNRVMHHEPIHDGDLESDHARIYRVLGALGPDLAKEVWAMDRFRSVLEGREGALD